MIYNFYKAAVIAAFFVLFFICEKKYEIKFTQKKEKKYVKYIINSGISRFFVLESIQKKRFQSC